MILGDQMKEKQLDFNQPLLSVRRHSSAPVPLEARERIKKPGSSLHKLPPLPHYKSELKSGPVSHPGKVPFVWEKVPGKPKEEKELQNCAALECRPAATKLPPGSTRKVELKNQDSGKDSKTIVDIDPRRIRQTHVVAQEVGKPVPKHESSGEGIVNGGDSCSEEGDEAFLDALDTFSRSDSFLNSSMISALSGLDGPNLGSPGEFNAEPVAQDFMMGRFLPAAQAMAADKPKCSTRKPLPYTKEIQRPKMVFGNRIKEDFPIVDENRPNVPLRNVLSGLGGKSEDDDCNDYEHSPAKVCGLLPWFCLLNPVPGIKNMQPPRPHSAHRVQQKSAYKGSIAENRTERTPCEELNKDEFDSGSKSSEISLKKDGKRLEGSNLYRRLQGNGQFLKPEEVSLQAAFEAEGSVGTAAEKLQNSLVDGGSSNPPGKRCMNFRELLASEGRGWESGSTVPVGERTLYVDSVRLVKSRDSTACSPASKVLANHDDLEFQIAALPNSACWEIMQSDLLPNDKLIGSEMEEIKKHVNFSPVPFDESEFRALIDTTESSANRRELAAEEAYSNGKIDLESSLTRNLVGREISIASNSNFHLPPPLPKSPSDSWLSRTLLAVSSKCSSSSQISLGVNIVPSRTIGTKSAPIETKWETIVRTSNVQHGHLRFSKVVIFTLPPLLSLTTVNSQIVRSISSSFTFSGIAPTSSRCLNGPGSFCNR